MSSERISHPFRLPMFPDLRREFWGRMFGYGIREAREAAGLSVEAAAQLAGMEVSEWDGHRRRPCPAGPEPAACHGRRPGTRLRPDRHAWPGLPRGLGAVSRGARWRTVLITGYTHLLRRGGESDQQARQNRGENE